jgi:Kae1-associated kinase Bud32
MRGAEATIEVDNDKVTKNRIKKSYRINQIDSKLRKERTKAEVKLINSARRAGVSVPKILDSSEHEIKMEYIKGEMLRDVIDVKFAEQVGESLTKLHGANLVHGDMTTSNMVIRDGIVHFIDFGLGFHSKRIEDKAVDLHLLERALNAKHPEISREFFKMVLKHYKPENREEILQRLSVIEGRGRYK